MTPEPPAPEPATLQKSFEAALADLPPMQRKFVLEYLKDLRQRDAAVRAGYSKKTADVQASQHLRKLKVRTAIDLGVRLYAMPEAEILFRLTAIARGSLADVMRLPSAAPAILADEQARDEQGATDLDRSHWRLDLVKAQETGAIHLIRKLKEGEHGPEVELHDAHAALRDLAKIHGLFKEDGILKYIDLSRLNDEQLTRLARGDDPLAVLLNQ